MMESAINQFAFDSGVFNAKQRFAKNICVIQLRSLLMSKVEISAKILKRHI